MCNWHNDSTDELCEAILSLKNREECYAFLEDICTIKELLEMSQRLSVAKLLSRGMSYSQISQKTGVSTATIRNPSAMRFTRKQKISSRVERSMR